MRLVGRVAGLGLLPAVLLAATQVGYDPDQRIWNLSNGLISAVFQLTPDGHFLTRQVGAAGSGDVWMPPDGGSSSPIQIETTAGVFDETSAFDLLGQASATVPGGMRQSIILNELQGRGQFTVVLEMYDNQPVLRYWLIYRNQTSSTSYVTGVNLEPWTFGDSGKSYGAMRVSQWSVAAKPGDFQTAETALDPGGVPFQVESGASGAHCGWLAVRDSDGRGLFAGWEFDGHASTTVIQQASGGSLALRSEIADLHHPVDPLGTFTTPPAFLGLFHGDYDEAAYRTQRFAEAILARPAPDQTSFPYVSWDSWGFQDKIDEQTLLRNADLAAAMGVQLFTVDLGWARAIGDWHADPAKFPNGLGVVADYVHTLGMKFGLHFALAEADPDSPVMLQHPEWAATDSGSYFGATPLCLSNKPAQDWLVAEAVRLIDEYHVDWILQDGQNMVKQCTRADHTHDAADSNYANSVQGINAVVAAIQAARPQVVWENCENGGSMMTFNMVRNYVTSITNDASGSLESRSAVYGATYPFPPRYAERYMPESDGLTPYATHSYRFGGPWVLMNQLSALDANQSAFLAGQIQRYKDQRMGIASGKVFHLLPPNPNGIDAIQSYNAVNDTAIAVVTRADAPDSQYLLQPRGLSPDRTYNVWFEIDSAVYAQTGQQLMAKGVTVALPAPFSSEVVHIEPRQ